MNFFRRKSEAQRITCENIVGDYGRILMTNPSGCDSAGRRITLPFDIELIKTSLVFMAVENGTPEGLRAAKEGFIALNTFDHEFTDQTNAMFDGVGDWDAAERALHATLDSKLNALEREFEERYQLMRGAADA